MPKTDWMQDCRQSGIGFQTDGKIRFGFHEGQLWTDGVDALEQGPISRSVSCRYETVRFSQSGTGGDKRTD